MWNELKRGSDKEFALNKAVVDDYLTTSGKAERKIEPS